MHQVQDNFGSSLFTLPLNGFAHAKHTQKKCENFEALGKQKKTSHPRIMASRYIDIKCSTLTWP